MALAADSGALLVAAEPTTTSLTQLSGISLQCFDSHFIHLHGVLVHVAAKLCHILSWSSRFELALVPQQMRNFHCLVITPLVMVSSQRVYCNYCTVDSVFNASDF